MTPSTRLQDTLALAARALIALLFIPEGWHQLGNFQGTAGYIAAAGVPLPQVAAATSVAVHIGIGLLVLVGWQARWAALALAVFTLVITFIFHNYWDAPAAQQMMQRINFFKNLALAGGLLYLVAFGPGGYSLDARRGKA
jgi:putative oxidoreductase